MQGQNYGYTNGPVLHNGNMPSNPLKNPSSLHSRPLQGTNNPNQSAPIKQPRLSTNVGISPHNPTLQQPFKLSPTSPVRQQLSPSSQMTVSQAGSRSPGNTLKPSVTTPTTPKITRPDSPSLSESTRRRRKHTPEERAAKKKRLEDRLKKMSLEERQLYEKKQEEKKRQKREAKSRARAGTDSGTPKSATQKSPTTTTQGGTPRETEQNDMDIDDEDEFENESVQGKGFGKKRPVSRSRKSRAKLTDDRKKSGSESNFSERLRLGRAHPRASVDLPLPKNYLNETNPNAVVNLKPLALKMTRIGVAHQMNITPEAVDYISYALQQRMEDLVTKVSSLTRFRTKKRPREGQTLTYNPGAFVENLREEHERAVKRRKKSDEAANEEVGALSRDQLTGDDAVSTTKHMLGQKPKKVQFTREDFARLQHILPQEDKKPLREQSAEFKRLKAAYDRFMAQRKAERAEREAGAQVGITSEDILFYTRDRPDYKHTQTVLLATVGVHREAEQYEW